MGKDCKEKIEVLREVLTTEELCRYFVKDPGTIEVLSEELQGYCVR